MVISSLCSIDSALHHAESLGVCFHMFFPFAVQKVQKLNFQGGLSFESTVL